MPELLTRASCRKDWKRISAALSLMSPWRPNRSKDWTEQRVNRWCREWKWFWTSYTYLSLQVKNLGNPAMCRYLQGWSERELGSWYGSMNRKRSGVGLINFDKIQWIKMNCCSTHNWLNYYSDTNAIQLLRWWMDWSKKAHAKYWVNKTCGKLRSGGSWVQLLEWQPLLATALCWSSTWKLD